MIFYGIWRRSAPRAELDVHERRQRDAEEAWDLRNEELADELDQLTGRLAETASDTTSGQITIPKGTRFLVRGRVRDRMIVTFENDKSLALVLEARLLRRVADE